MRTGWATLTYAWHRQTRVIKAHINPARPFLPLSPIHLHLLEPPSDAHDLLDDSQGVYPALFPPPKQRVRAHTPTACQMSATQKVQQHPAFLQAQDKANYYVNQLDKEVRYLLTLMPIASYEYPC